jgi:hypothetical protein
MSRSWKRGYAFCDATNKDGTRCGNKVACMPSGAAIYRKCAVHRRMAEEQRRRERAEHMALIEAER